MVAMGFLCSSKWMYPVLPPPPAPPKKKEKKHFKKPEYTQVYITMNFNLCISLLTWLWTFKCRSKMKIKNIVLFTKCVCVRGTHTCIGCTHVHVRLPTRLSILNYMYHMQCYACTYICAISRKLIECFRHELSLFVNDTSSKADKI